MDLNTFIDHFLGLKFESQFFKITNILNCLITERKKKSDWQATSQQIDRHLADKRSFRDISVLYHSIIGCIIDSHQLDNFIFILCITDQFYIHIREVCLSSATRDILCEISAILLFHLKKRFEDIANVLVLLEFHDERAI